MDKIHAKTNKLFDEIRKQKIKLIKNVNKDKLSKDDIADLHYKCCIYCGKVFSHSKFLLKHFLRRHSNELVLFYRNFTNRDFNYTSDDLQHLIDILQKEFSSLKKELCFANLLAEGKREADSLEKNQVIGEEQATRIIKRNQDSNGDIVSNEISDLKEKPKVLDIEKDIQNLNDKFIELNNVLKNEVLKKQDVHEKLVLSEEKIMRAQESQFNELREILLDELKSILHNQQQNINSEWKSQLLELKYEIKRLDYAVSNVQQITCIDSLKEEIRKELMPQIVPHLSSAKCGKRKHNHTLAKSELSFNKSHSTSQKKKMPQEGNFCSKESNFKSCENLPDTPLKTVDELASVVADKLSEFSIEPNTSKLSSAEYNKILKFINFEKEQLQKKYGNFSQIYNKINKAANQRTHSKLKSKKHHKIKFSEPLTSSRIRLAHSFEGSMSEQSPSIQNVNGEFFSTISPLPSNSKNISGEKICLANESTSFTFPDKGASGDSVHPYSHKQKIPVKHTNSIKRVEASSPIEDTVNSYDLTASFSYGDITVAEQHKYKRHSNSISLVKQREFNPPVNKNSSQFKEKEMIEFVNKDNIDKSSHPIRNKQNMPLRHTKLSYAEEFGNSSSVKDHKNSRDLNAKFTKDSVIVAAGQGNYKNQKKLNSAVGSHSVLFEESQISRTKTLEKLSELDEYCNSDNDFDDISSLETYKSSDDDDKD